MENISKEIQEELARFQQLQEQYQFYSSQRVQMEHQLSEIENTMGRLKDIDDGTPLYQNLGSVLIRVKGKKSLEDEMDEKKQTLQRRTDSMKQQEERLKKQIESMGEELNEKLKSSGLA